jgi:REP-associated tyrosine transposase
MARLPRIVVPNQPLHIMHRGNNRQDIFETDEDMMRIKEDLAVSLSKSDCRLHAYVIMTNHLHLLVTPADKEQLKAFMQSVTNRYVRYFNASRQRTGTMWEGRFKSCLVDSDSYLFALYKYIEMNPIKANMVSEISHYPWSSYHYNALGLPDELISEHALYDDLASDRQQRCDKYKFLFDALELSRHDKHITQATIRGEVLGDEEFHQKMSKELSRPTRLTTHGGDRKSDDYQNSSWLTP